MTPSVDMLASNMGTFARLKKHLYMYIHAVCIAYISSTCIYVLCIPEWSLCVHRPFQNCRGQPVSEESQCLCWFPLPKTWGKLTHERKLVSFGMYMYIQYLIFCEGVFQLLESTVSVFAPYHQLGYHGVIERGHFITYVYTFVIEDLHTCTWHRHVQHTEATLNSDLAWLQCQCGH